MACFQGHTWLLKDTSKSLQTLVTGAKTPYKHPRRMHNFRGKEWMVWLKTLILEQPRIAFPTSCMMEAKSVGTEGEKMLEDSNTWMK